MASSSSSSKKKTIRLRSSDGESFEVLEERIGAASPFIKVLLDEALADGEIALPKVTGGVLSRVLEYVNRHFDPAEAPPPSSGWGSPLADSGDRRRRSDDLADFDCDFISVKIDTIIDLIEAANYLAIEGLLDLGCQAVAEKLRGRTVDQIRETFHVVNDYTKEEEEEVRAENSWAFE
ncbi:hypothetical protein ACP4OV_006384 [Aristida adscensionis]